MEPLELSPDEVLQAAAAIAGNMFLNAAITEARANKLQRELTALKEITNLTEEKTK